MQNLIQSHHYFRMPRPSFRTAMVSITYYDNSINILDNPCQKHLNRNQIMAKKKRFSQRKYSNNSVNSTMTYTTKPCFWDCDGFY